MKGYLLLEDGTTLVGRAFGSTATALGEIFFHTEMAGYEESFNDPANAGQVMVMTYPLLGNYGFANEDLHTEKVPAAVVVRDYAEVPSHYRSVKTLSDFLKERDIFGLAFVDTRLLTRKIRDNGSQKCLLTIHEPSDADRLILKSFEPKGQLQGSTKETLCYGAAKNDKNDKNSQSTNQPCIALLDLGSCGELVEQLQNEKLYRLPYQTTAEDIMAKSPDLVLLSHGGANPECCKALVETVKTLLANNIPVRAVGFGALILALALGAEYKKMNNGHRGSNYPVLDKKTNKVLITTQNHGYDIIGDLKATITHENINDGTIEGFVVDKNGVNAAAVLFALKTEQTGEMNVLLSGWLESIQNKAISGGHKNA